MTKLDRDAFKRGVDDVLLLRPLRERLGWKIWKWRTRHRIAWGVKLPETQMSRLRAIAERRAREGWGGGN